MMRTRRCAIGPFLARFGLFLVKNSFFDLEISKNGQNRVFLGQKLGSYFFVGSFFRILRGGKVLADFKGQTEPK